MKTDELYLKEKRKLYGTKEDKNNALECVLIYIMN